MGLFARIFGRRRRRAAPPAQQTRAESAAPRVASPSSAFTPTRPKPGRRQLVGREAELTRIVQAIVDERAHVVLYSERGRGKTSLANLATEALRRQDRIVARYTCEASSTFDTVMRGLARDLPASILTVSAGMAEGCEAALPLEPLKPRDVADLPSRLSCRAVVCVVDEFDRIEDPRTRTLFADTIKQVSDRGIGLSFVIVGVSENLEQIIGEHPSIQRNIAAVHLPLLGDSEIAAMLEKGGRDSGLVFPAAMIARVSAVARGMPYMAQLLGLRIAQAALARGASTAEESDMDAAIDRLLQDARHQIVAQYDRLTDGGRDHKMAAALRRIAMAEQDRWGRVTLVEYDDGVQLGGQMVTAGVWNRLLDESVLRPTEGSPALLTFADRSLAYHVLLLAVRDSGPAVAALAEARAKRALAASGG